MEISSGNNHQLDLDDGEKLPCPIVTSALRSDGDTLQLPAKFCAPESIHLARQDNASTRPEDSLPASAKGPLFAFSTRTYHCAGPAVWRDVHLVDAAPGRAQLARVIVVDRVVQLNTEAPKSGHHPDAVATVNCNTHTWHKATRRRSPRSASPPVRTPPRTSSRSSTGSGHVSTFDALTFPLSLRFGVDSPSVVHDNFSVLQAAHCNESAWPQAALYKSHRGISGRHTDRMPIRGCRGRVYHRRVSWRPPSDAAQSMTQSSRFCRN